ncbi:bactofilin family protein [Hyalangium sp.]|uniref:bactofilin family protein n=1 Tax=Hyalangium sp. TaxID=2028555 RepID=UPI0039C8AE34
MALLGGKKDEAPSTTTSKPLFKREEDFVSTRPGDIHTLLGKGSEFTGKLTFEGQVRIDGKFNGEIFTKDTIVIGDGARVEAKISAGTVIIHGTVVGNVTALQIIELKQPGRVKGDLTTPALTIERGASYDGTCTMEGSRPPVPGGVATEKK